ncbi:MAG: hypothetical protein QM758_19895 [Armatimonas sp.]
MRAKLGVFMGVLGALLVLVGAALPWARFTVFGLEVSLPGGLWPRGAACVGLAVVAALSLRRLPYLAAALAVACLITAWQARTQAPREVIRRTLEIQQALNPINDKLARITVPPIDPFGGIGSSRDHAGVGSTITLIGGVLLLGGAALRLMPERCRSCRTPWRSAAFRFCPTCGIARTTGPHCGRCGEPMQKRDSFCTQCGQKA